MSEGLVNIDMSGGLVNIDVPEGLVNIDMSKGLVNIDMSEVCSILRNAKLFVFGISLVNLMFNSVSSLY